MVINGLMLPGSADGVAKYLGGEPNVSIDYSALWSDAAGQIFFSIGVCMGVMTSYGSYNPVKKPIITDNFIIAISTCLFSFVAGFAVWSVVGYLESINSLARSHTSSVGLAFIAYPTAIT